MAAMENNNIAHLIKLKSMINKASMLVASSITLTIFSPNLVMAKPILSKPILNGPSDAQSVNKPNPIIQNNGVLLAHAANALVGQNLNEVKLVANAYNDGLGIDLEQLVKSNNTKAKHRKSSRKVTVTNVTMRHFLGQKSDKLAIYADPRDYKSGDIIVQKLKRGTRIAIVTDELDSWHIRPLIIYSNGKKVIKDNSLETYKIISHYRYGID